METAIIVSETIPHRRIEAPGREPLLDPRTNRSKTADGAGTGLACECENTRIKEDPKPRS